MRTTLPAGYLGDALFAVAEGEGHRRRAVRFAVDYVARAAHVSEARSALAERWMMTIRAGVASGPVVIGPLGNTLRSEHATIGRTVNLAARLQSVANPGEVVVDAERDDEIGDRAREHAQPKGFRVPIPFVRFTPD